MPGGIARQVYTRITPVKRLSCAVWLVKRLSKLMLVEFEATNRRVEICDGPAVALLLRIGGARDVLQVQGGQAA
jgi:hypothetical protein